MKHFHKPPSQRQLRVGEHIRHILADLLRRGHFRDPALIDADITVSEVRISPDLKNATAFVMPLGGQDTEAVVAGLNRAAAYIRREISRELDLRFTPTMTFAVDTTFDEAEKIEKLLHSDPVARDLRTDSENG